MTIKTIKEAWQAKEFSIRGKKQFAVYNFGDPIGKCIILVINNPYAGRYVDAIIQVKTGEDILNGHCRPCDNMDDAIDVAGEMIQDNWDDLIIR